jgi:hypothetical protein
MDASLPLSSCRRVFRTCAATAAALSLLLVGAQSALADAADPVPAATTGSAVYNGDGSRTVTISGQWQWTTHHSDCNLDKRAVGFAIDWGDANGNHVTTIGADSIDVGVLNADAYNAADNAVHPTPVTTFPAAPFGGCGTFDAGLGYNSGTWGPITHTYAPGAGVISACPLMYDVHLASNGGAPNDAKETTAGGANHNGDNGAEKNANTPLGNGCFGTTFPALTTQASAGVSVGGAIHDTASLSGGSNPTGSITFRLYDNATCSGTPVYTSPGVAVNGNGDYASPDFTSTAAGSYHWVASYSGDGNNQAVSNACGDASETVTVSPAPPVPAGQQEVLGERVTPGEAHLAGASGCIARKFKVAVTGKQISSVVFTIDGKRRATLRKPDSKGRYTITVNPKRFKPGSHVLTAKSVFTAASNTKSKTQKLRFARCVRRTAPAFTG